MTIKLVGAAMIIASSSGCGFYIAFHQRKEVSCLQKLLAIIEFMEWELEYRLAPLPYLCESVAHKTNSLFSPIFSDLVTELTNQQMPDVSACMRNVLSSQKRLPDITRGYLEKLGDSLGEYNVEGQLKSLMQLRQHINQTLNELTDNQTQRLRCYQTLGVCAGAALAILLI